MYSKGIIKYNIIFFIVIFFITSNCLCNNILNITKKKIILYTKKDSLKDDYIFCVDQDSNGDLWIGTRAGASHFDGINFTNYDELNGFTDKTVWAVFCDKNDNKWFGTEGDGIFLFDGNNWGNYKKKGKSLSRNNYFDGFIIQDSNGIIWGGGEVSCLFKFHNNKYYEIDAKVQGIIQDYKGNLLGIESNGEKLYKYSEQINEFKSIYDNFDSTLDIGISTNNEIWIAGDMDYIARSNDFGNTFEKFKFNKQKSGNFWDIFIDKDNNVWAAFTNNIVYFDGLSFKYFDRSNGLPIGHYKFIFQDSHGHMWFCCFGGLAKFDIIPPKIKLNKKIPQIVQSPELYFSFSGYDGKLGTIFDNLTHEYLCISHNLWQNTSSDYYIWQKSAKGHVLINNLQNNTTYHLILKVTDECQNSSSINLNFIVNIDQKITQKNSYPKNIKACSPQTQIIKKEKYDYYNIIDDEISDDDFIDLTKEKEKL